MAAAAGASLAREAVWQAAGLALALAALAVLGYLWRGRLFAYLNGGTPEP